MALKRYHCSVHPNLRIQSTVKFLNGFFETDSPALQALIMRNDCWGWGIKEVPALNEVPPAPEIPEMAAAVEAVIEQSTEEVVIEKDPMEALWDQMTFAKQEEEPEPEPELPSSYGKSINEITATDINTMRVPDLKVLADEIGAVIPEDRKLTGAVLKRACRLKLGV